MLNLRRCFSVKASANAISPRILVTGASGQLGMGMIRLLQQQYGQDCVVASDIRPPPTISCNNSLNFKYLNVLDKSQLSAMVVNERINWLIHFSAILSYKGEQNPDHAFKVNIEGVQNVLEVSKDYSLKVFVPSTIGVYGKESPKDNVQDVDIQRPNTVYGITKVYAELIGQYYYEKFGVDFRSLRYPGVLSGDSQPGGGTTDYAVEIFHSIFDNLKAHSNGNTRESVYQCPLGNDQMLPMMHIDDCLNATLQILATDRLSSSAKDNSDLRVFNVSGLSFTPKELEHGIQRFLKDKLFVSRKGDKFSIKFNVDYSRVDPVRSSIAASWPHSLDDSRARTVWGYEPSVKSIDRLVAIMINQISALKGFSIMKQGTLGIAQSIGLRYSRIATAQQLRMFSAPSVAVQSTAESVIAREKKPNTSISESDESSATNRVLPNFRGDFREQLCRTPYLGTSVKKLNFLAHLIKGLSAEDAILELMFAKKDDTKEILWAVQKGCQIARDVQGVNPKDLYVAYTMVNRGPYQKSVTIHGRGRAGRKRTPSAHMIIMLREKSFKIMAEQKAKEKKFARTPRPRADKHVTNPKIKFH